MSGQKQRRSASSKPCTVMAFFCPGSSVKIKKEADSSKRPHPSERQTYNHSPYPPYLPNNTTHQWPSYQPNNSRYTVTEKVQDVSAPQAPISDQFLQKLIVLQDYCASKDLELTVRRGERIEVINREGEWLFIRNERGKEGYVPSKNCAPPVASSSRRTRKNSRSSVPLRTVASGDTSGVRDSIPIFSTNSSGQVYGEFDQHKSATQHVSFLPSNNILSPSISGSIDKNTARSLSSNTSAYKNSPSSSSGMAECCSSALIRTYSQDELNPEMDTNSAVNTDISASTFLVEDVHSKQSSSDDTGTIDTSQFKDNDYATSTVHNETSSDDGSMKQERGSSISGGTTPSIKDRPLPSPPRIAEDVPPPIPPRHDSLSRFKPLPTHDDIDPYSSPVDNLNSDITDPKFVSQSRVKSLIDIHHKDSGINSPYSEVYRGRRNKRPTTFSDDARESSPGQARRSSSFSRHRSPKSNIPGHSVERRGSPRVNGERRLPPTPLEDSRSPVKGVMKFRKFLWGVYVCTQDFEACDENEVSVHCGESVLVFNQEDSNWFWVVKHKTDNSEGFVPSFILHEVADAKATSESVAVPFRHTQSPSNTTHSDVYRPRLSSSHLPPSATTQRPRMCSTGSSPIQKVLPSSTEKIPGKLGPLSPSSPPPPYAEKDPIPTYPHTINRSHAIQRNRPTYPGRGGRVSLPYPMYSPGLSHMTRSSSHLASSTHFDSPYHNNNSVTATGGTLV